MALSAVGRRAGAGGSRSAAGVSRCWRSVCCPRSWPCCSASRSSAAGSSGAYFAILSQALAAAFAILLVGHADATGGINGLNNFRGFFGFNLYDPVNKQMLFFIAAGVLLVDGRAGPRQLMIAAATASCWWPCRDAEERVRFLGYDPANSRPSPTWSRRSWRASPGRCSSRSSASSRPPTSASSPSIGFLIGVAIGGRTTLLGPVLGAIAVAWAGTTLSETIPVGLDLHPGPAVHAGHRVPAGRPGVAVAASGAGCARRLRRPPPPSPTPVDPAEVRRRPIDGGDVGMSDATTWSSRDLTVAFDGFVAVDGVDLSVLPGDLRFLIGPNGAGKTTLIDAITGLVQATGSARFGGHELLGQKVHRIARLGVGRTFQTATVFEELTVLQNLDIAAGRRRGALTLLRRRSGVPDEVAATLETIGLTDLVDVPAGHPAARPEAVAGDRHAAGAGREAAAAGRAGRRDERRGARRDRASCCSASPRSAPSSSSSTTWTSCGAFATSVTVLHAGKVLSRGHAWPRSRPTRRCRRSTSGTGHHAEDEVAAMLGGGRLMLQMLDVEAGYGRTVGDPRRRRSRCPPDGVAAVMGHNGAGKTTLLRAAVGLLPVRSGRDPARRRGRHRAAPRTSGCARGLAYVPQGQQSFGQLTTAENLQLVADGEAQRPGADRRGARPVPGAARPADPPRRPALGRPAPAAGHRPGADHRAAAADPRRADRGHPAVGGRRDRADDRRADPARRALGAAGRAARRVRAATRRGGTTCWPRGG